MIQRFRPNNFAASKMLSQVGFIRKLNDISKDRCKLGIIAVQTFCVKVAHNVIYRRKQNVFCLRDANSMASTHVGTQRGNIRKTFKVSVSSGFPKCFLVFATTQYKIRHKTCVLYAEMFFEFFQKHYFLPVRNFVSETMFYRLHRTLK